MIRAGIVGATGSVGMELVRLLTAHPGAEVTRLCSHSQVGDSYAGIYRNFAGLCNLELTETAPEELARECDVVFTSLPHAASAATVERLVDAGVRVIDMSADFRYKDPEVYRQWYKVEPAKPELMAQAVYGLPEYYREDIRRAKLIGNPGCFVTSAILALAPLLSAGLIEEQGLIVDAKSGTTGAGRTPSQAQHFSEVDESFKAYNVAKHRHTSEIEQELSLAAGEPVVLQFTPHLLPVKRGILSTCYARMKRPLTHAEVMEAYRAAYGDEFFITLHGEGSLPELKYVVGSNRCHIGFVPDGRTGNLVVISAIDNLIKGAAGQAIQNMNLMMGLEETAGLAAPAWYL